MFWAALAAQCAGERTVTANRIVAALLRTPSVRALRDSADLFAAVDDPRTLSFAECELRVMQDLVDHSLELGSKEHQATVERRPLEPAVKPVFDALLLEDQFLVSPLELLLALIRADPALAERLAPHGLTIDTISAALAADEQ